MYKQLYCNHWKKDAKKTSVYGYKLIVSELNICKNCEKKLRKQILEQDKIEKEMDGTIKKWKKFEKLNKNRRKNHGKKKTNSLE